MPSIHKGGIVYVRERIEEHASLEEEQYYMDQYLDIPKEVVIAPFGQSRIPITVNTPNKNEGALLGGVLFNLKDAGSVTTQSTDNSLSFTANYAINIGIPIQLNFPISRDDQPLGVGKADEETLPTGSSIGVEVNNPNQTLVHDVSYNYEILNEKDEIVSKGTVPSFNIPPRSNFKLQFPWDSSSYQAGIYNVRLTPSYSKESIVREFEITREDVKKYTEITGQEPTIPVLNIPFYNWILLVIAILLTIYGAYRLGRGKNGQEAAIKGWGE